MSKRLRQISSLPDIEFDSLKHTKANISIFYALIALDCALISFRDKLIKRARVKLLSSLCLTLFVYVKILLEVQRS